MTYINVSEVSTVRSMVNSTMPDTTALNKAVLRYWRALIFGVGGTFVCSIGILCNITAVLVLIKFKTTSSAPFLLICLAGLDAIYLLFMMTFENMTIMSSAEIISRRYNDITLPIYKYFFAIPLIAQTCISYTVLLISVERFVVVAWPFKAFVICSKKIAAFSVTSILLFGVLFHVPDYLAYEYRYEWYNKTKSMKLFFGRTRYGQSRMYNEVFSKWVSMSVNFLIPFLLLLVVNINLLKALRASKSLPGVQNRAQSEYRLTIMVFCMTAIFFLFELLEASSFIMTAGFVSYNQSSSGVQRFTACADLLTEINSAANFLIYCASGRKFRDMFCRVFLPCVNRQRARATVALTLRSVRHATVSHKPWTSWEFLASSVRCYQVRPSEGSISSSSTKSSKANSIHGYNNLPTIKFCN